MIALPTFRGVLSGFSPLSLAPALWLDAETLSGSDGTQISTWADRSGNSRDATQATGGAQPKLYNNVLNGKKVVRFDGVDDVMEVDLTNPISQPITIFAVTKQSGLPSVNGRVIHSSDPNLAGSTFFPLGLNSSGNHLWNFGTDTVTGVSFSSNFAIYGVIANGSQSATFRNGASLFTGNPGSNGIARYLYVGNLQSGLRGLNGDIAEILIFSTALSALNRQRVERYLGAKYAITVA
jgi:hypothetical protein